MLSDHQLQKKLEILSNKLNLGNFAEVIEEASILIKKNKHQVLFNILSLAYQSTGQLKKSESIMDEALRINPNNPYFLNNMGTTQHKMDNYLKAEEYFLRGLKIAPNYINILNNLGNLNKDLDNSNKALEYYKKSLSINSQVVETLLNISILYQSLGEFSKATIHLKNLSKINPKFTIADRLMSSMIKYKENDNHLHLMEKKSTELELDNIQSANLFFAMAKAYEDQKQYKKSFNSYNKGNELLKRLSSFKIEDEQKNFENIKKIFLNPLKKIELEESRNLIFIVGMPRSGTSLVEQILSSHKNVYGGGELTYLKKILDRKFLNKIENQQPLIIKNADSVFKEVHYEYMNSISVIDKSSKVFIDKAPLNFKYIGFIKKIFPNSKVINCRRNSLDVCWSNFKNYFGQNLPFTNNLNDIANYYKIYDNLINFWEDMFPQEIYEMNYNLLVQNSEDQIRKLLNFCELDWDQNCLKHEQNNKSIKTASAGQARQPINKLGLKTFEPFKNYLTDLSNILES